MKKIVLLVLVLGVLACKDESKNIVEGKEELFWKYKLKINNNTSMEYPIKKDSIVSEQRTNRIYLDNMECQFEVFVDDVLLYKVMGEITQSGGGISSDNDINQLLLSTGTHELKVRMYPAHGRKVFGREGYLNFVVSYFKDRDLRTIKFNESLNGHNGIHIDQKDKQWIEKWDSDNRVGYDGDYVVKQPHKLEGLPVYEWRTEFFAAVPFSYEGWRGSVSLAKEQEDKKDVFYRELHSEYKRIHEVIKNKDTASYLSLVKEREELITATLFYKDAEKKLRADEFVKLIQGPDYEIEPLVEEMFHLEFQGYGKLAMFLNKTDGEGVIRLRNKSNPDDTIYMDFHFQRKKAGEKLTVI